VNTGAPSSATGATAGGVVAPGCGEPVGRRDRVEEVAGRRRR
jgi:hypothetical protein